MTRKLYGSMTHLRANWKKYVAAAGIGAGAYYGVPPEITHEFLKGVAAVLGF
jgi:hypothetical protein